MTHCLFLINFNHIFFLHSQFFWSVIISNSLTFKEKPEWIHGNSLSLTVWFFEFLEMCRHFHFEVNLTAILSNDFEFNILSFLLIPTSPRLKVLLPGQTWWRWLPPGSPHTSGLGEVEPRSGVYKSVSLPNSTTPWLAILLLTWDFLYLNWSWRAQYYIEKSRKLRKYSQSYHISISWHARFLSIRGQASK